MINQRLFEHYKIDTKKNLQIKNICPRPYDTVLIDKNGSCYACECQSWLPQSIGNLQLKSLDEIINSKMQQHLQSSVADGSYRYCNEHQCSYIKSNAVLHGQPERRTCHRMRYQPTFQKFIQFAMEHHAVEYAILSEARNIYGNFEFRAINV